MGAKPSLLHEVDINKPLDAHTLQKILDEYDKDHSSYLDKQEVEAFVTEWCKVHKVADVQGTINAFMDKYDTNKDERISLQDFPLAQGALAHHNLYTESAEEHKAEKAEKKHGILAAIKNGLSRNSHLGQILHSGTLSDDQSKAAEQEWHEVEKTLENEKESSSSALFSCLNHGEDPRLDYWTTTTIKIIAEKQYKWTKPPMSALTEPKLQRILDKITLHHTPLSVPTVDEDWDMPTGGQMAVAKFLRNFCPMEDNLKHRWLPDEDKEAYVRQILGSIWPRTNVYWNDRLSDDALERLAFLGLGQAHLAKLQESKYNDAYYGIELDFMQALEVRPGFAKYGASAYFNKQGKVVRIVRGGQEHLPGSPRWEYVKMCFRGSLITLVTSIDHLFGIHAIVSNFLTTASREYLPPDHPMRRLIKPFTFRSAYINYSAGINLFSPRGFLHRAFALTEQGMAQTWKIGWETLKYEPFPDLAKKMKIDSVSIPLIEDGLELWNIFHNFVNDYVYLYYPEEQHILRDQDVQAFWNEIRRLMPPQAKLSFLARHTLVEFLTYSFFMVSAGHNFLGTIAEYVSDPDFCPTVWTEAQVEGQQPCGLPLYAVRAGLIMTATGFPQPKLMDDFSGVMLDDKAKAICHVFRAALHKQTAVVDKRNIERKQPFQSMNPRFIELAVSI